MIFVSDFSGELTPSVDTAFCSMPMVNQMRYAVV